MQYTNIIISFCAACLSFYFLIKNIGANKLSKNYLFSIISFFAGILFLLIILNELQLNLISSAFTEKIYYSIVMLIVSFLSLQFIIYPQQITGFLKPALLITIVPGIASVILLILSELIELNLPKLEIAGSYDFPFLIFVIISLIYSAVILLIVLYKIFSDNYYVIRRDLVFLLLGLIIGIFSYTYFYFINYKYYIIGISVTASFLLFIFHSSIYRISEIDLKKRYVEVAYWTIITALMFLPVYITLLLPQYSSNKTAVQILIPGIAVVYLFLFFKFIKPVIEKKIWKGYNNLALRFTEAIPTFEDIASRIIEEKKSFWDYLYTNAIDGFLKKFEISSGYLFIFDQKNNSFDLNYSSGIKISINSVAADHDLIKALIENHDIIDQKKLIFSELYTNTKDKIISLMKTNSFEVIIPLFDMNDQISGFVALSNLSNNRLYSQTFLKALDLYRIQFQYQFSNGQFLEKVKTEKISEHDKISLKIIKSRVIPEVLPKIKNVRLASFYLNNSDLGGDYFDSVNIDDNTLMLFTADTGYSGIDSGKKYLLLYSMIHGHSKNLNTAELLFDRTNKMLIEQQKSGDSAGVNAGITILNTKLKQIIYSSAGYNPLIIYSPGKQEFIEKNSSSVPLSISKDVRFKSDSLKMESGQIGFIYSDGFITSINDKGELYQVDRVKKIISTNSHVSPSVLVRKIYKDFKDFIKDNKQLNDISFIIFRIN